MQVNPNARRSYGTGSLIEQRGSYYGKWRVDGRQVMRKIGPVRQSAARDGLTKPQAEGQLRKLMADVTPPPVTERITVGEAADRLLEHLEAMGRKHSTLRAYRSKLKAQIKPRMGHRPIARVTRDEVEAFVSGCLRDGLSAKYATNCLGLLHSVFEIAIRREWATTNPCRYVDAPKAVEVDTAIHFLDSTEVEALLSAVPDSDHGRVQRVLYIAAAMTGMRQGELLALRWRDVDWSAQRIRVSRNYVNGTFGTPKSRRGSRSVPRADRLGDELDLHYQRSAFQADDDLVFANPHTGRPINGHTLTRTFQRTLQTAGVRQVRFHDLRHTFGTRMAAAGVPMRTLQEWMGHRDFKTTLIYADYAPGAHEVDLVNEAFASTNPSTSLSATQTNSNQLHPVNTGTVRLSQRPVKISTPTRRMHSAMRSNAEYAVAMGLVARGLNDCEVARATGSLAARFAVGGMVIVGNDESMPSKPVRSVAIHCMTSARCRGAATRTSWACTWETAT